MKKVTHVATVAIIAMAAFQTTPASAQFVLSGEIRPRTEYLHGYKTLSTKDQDVAFWTEQRSRLKFDYASDTYKAGLVLQDVRVWGSTAQLNKSDAFSSIHEAWGEILCNKHLSLKVGRQELIYDDHRIFGNVGWTQQARSHDLAKLRYKDSLCVLDVGVAFNQDATMLNSNVYAMTGNYKAMQYAWFHRDLKTMGVSVLVLNNGLQYSTTDTAGVKEYSVKYSQTAGTHLSYKKNKCEAAANLFYQMGRDGADKQLGAYEAGASLNYNATERWMLGAGYELLSGTSQVDTANKDNHSFNPLYGTNHKFNGFMDYFYVGSHLNTVGLQDAYVRLAYKEKKCTAGVDVHLFSSAADILDNEKLTKTGKYEAMSASLGTEVDLSMQYKVSEELIFQAGYSQMLATKSMEALKGGSKDAVNNWAYLMFTFKPVFVKQ